MLHIPGKFCLLFSAPEATIGSEKWRECLLQFPINERIVALAVDEAHCVSKWYVYYRYYETDHVCLMMFTLLCVQESDHCMQGLVKSVPSYLLVLAATATVTRRDVCSKLKMIGCRIVCFT